MKRQKRPTKGPVPRALRPDVARLGALFDKARRADEEARVAHAEANEALFAVGHALIDACTWRELSDALGISTAAIWKILAGKKRGKIAAKAA